MHQLIDKKNKIFIYLLFLIILSTTSNKFIKKDKHSSFIGKININGLSSVDSSKLQSELSNFFYENVYALQKDEIDTIISKHNIIEEYNVKKIYPSSLLIKIKTTKLIAKISGIDQLAIGANGKLIKIKETNEILPYIFGKFNSKEFLRFKKNIDNSKFDFTKLKSLYFFPSNRWDVITNDDILIKLPQENLPKALSLAYKIINNDEFKGKKVVDLRINNNLVVK
jgi:cell division protein FtsQ